MTGRPVTDILHLINKNHLYWYSKKQVSVETDTYGSEIVAGRTYTWPISDIKTTIRYLEVPLRKKRYMFGDNESIINGTSIHHEKLHNIT